MTPFRVAIPARYGATRLPGKPLRELAGRTMIEHVYRRAEASGAVEIVIATDDQRIAAVARGFGADVCLTRSDHLTGTDRLAEVASQRGWAPDTVVVNLQGDEPLMPPELLVQVAENLAREPDAGIATLCTPIHDEAEVNDPNVVKVVRDGRKFALYFSRSVIPFQRAGGSKSANLSIEPYWRHLGMYAYRADVLGRYPTMAPAPCEQAEALEQLRALWHGIKIHVDQAHQTPPPGVDTEADLARAAAQLQE